MIELKPIWLSLQLAFISTIILFLISIPISYWLAYSRSRVKPFFETLISLPLVLPPTVLGFYLLILFSPNGFPGSFLNQYLEVNLLFSFSGLVFASVIYSLPFMVNPIRSGFAGVQRPVIEASWVLGKSKFSTLVHVIIPNSKIAILSALVMSFAHTLGEFGVVLMIGGNIPDKTRVASIAIYDKVEALDYASANTYSIILISIAFLILFSVYYLNRGKERSSVV